MLDKTFSDFVGTFNYEKIVKSEDSMSKWLKNMKTFYFNSLKDSNLNIDSKH